MMKYLFVSALIVLLNTPLFGQSNEINGSIKSGKENIPFINIALKEMNAGTISDGEGNFIIKNIPDGEYTLLISGVGYEPFNQKVVLSGSKIITLDIELKEQVNHLEEFVVTGTLKEVNRLESPVPVEVYQQTFFRKNPTSCIFDAVQGVNGVRPQLNCNVCNTGDIHINGLEGPYTMILIDGMPIVSGLSSVYGLSGIPNSLVERIEIIKGPASSLYGSEAVGGLINVITKKVDKAPLFSVDFFATSWQEYNADVAFKAHISKKITSLTGINYFQYQNPIDNNGDNFTDLTLQRRISVFQKVNFERKQNRIFSLAGRYFFEDRWGGDMRWTPAFRGGDSIYGESIGTKRWEIISNYQLPLKEKVLLSFSYNKHDQNSYYGTVKFLAQQEIAFAQLTWDKKIKSHDFLIGSAIRYTYYDDNTPATEISDSVSTLNQPSKTWLPGVFIQDEISIAERHKLLIGFRYDYNSQHGNIFTPRIAYKWKINERNNLRFNAGTGFRVVNLFTEEHAALTGARKVIVKESLRPEQSYNLNLNFTKKIFSRNENFINLELAAWYTYFNNRIIANYDLDPNLIYYENLGGFAVSRGLSMNMDVELKTGIKLMAGITYMDVYKVEDNELGVETKTAQILTEKWTGTWALSYKIPKININIDYTGNFYGPMRLPLLGNLDPRNEYSPLWSIQNIQFTWAAPLNNLEIYLGVKNLLNFTPPSNSITRTNDPFDKKVNFDASGQVIATAENPYGLTFDTGYVYASNQGIRMFLGLRYLIR